MVEENQSFAPDLLSGSLVNAVNKENIWLTPVQAVLHNSHGTYYLAKECRAEQTPVTGKTERLFNRIYEVVLAKFPSGAFIFRSGVNIPLVDKLTRAALRSGLVDIEINVRCPDREIRYFATDHLLKLLKSSEISSNEIFMEVAWNNQVLYCPAHYVNFPNSNLYDYNYLQPISGQVLYSAGDEERASLAYVVAIVRDAKTEHLEFIVRENVWVLSIARGIERLGVVGKVLAMLCPIKVDEYSKSIPVIGSVRFYSYK